MIPYYGNLRLDDLLRASHYAGFSVRVLSAKTGKVLLYEVRQGDKNHDYYWGIEIDGLKTEMYIENNAAHTRIICYTNEELFYRRKNGEYFEERQHLIGWDDIKLFGDAKDCVLQERYRLAVEANNKLMEQLKNIAKAIQGADISQPSQCLFGKGTCGYPIDDCYKCPMHEWSDYSFPLTSCEFK